MQPRMLVAFFIVRLCADSWSSWYPPGRLCPTPGPSLQSCFPVGQPQCVLVDGVIPPQVQDFTFSLVELHRITLCPFLQPVEVPLNGSVAISSISHSSQYHVWLCVVSALSSRFFMKVKLYWPQYQPLGCTTSDWPPVGLHASDDNLLGPAVQLTFSSSHCPLIQPVLHQLVCEDVMGDSVNSFSKVEIKNISCSPLIHVGSHLTVQSN